MYSQIRRTKKTTSKHKLDKKKSQISRMPYSLKSGNSTTINYSINPVTEHIFVPHVYEKERKYNWEGRKEIVEIAISNAIVHLEKASKEPMVQSHKIIIDAIRDIIEIFNDQTLKVYPFFGLCDGLAEKDKRNISIRTTLVVSVLKNKVRLYRLEKTLIHEAFHIIGGCAKGKSSDSICEDSVDKNSAFEKIVLKSSIQEMEADDFAQFVMQC